MKLTADELYLHARQLSPAERAALAGRLLDELEGPRDEGVEEAWIEEIDRRLAAYDRGETRGIPAAQVLKRIRERRGR